MVSDHAKRNGVRPVSVAVAIAIFGILAMLVVDHGPWSRPHPQNPRFANYQTTGEAAHAVGAHVTPTLPKSARAATAHAEAGRAAQSRARNNPLVRRI